MRRTNALASAVMRIAVGSLAATIQKGARLIFVPLRNCPKPTSAVGQDPHLGRAYCRKDGRDCPMLQMVFAEGNAILCKSADPQERKDTEPQKR